MISFICRLPLKVRFLFVGGANTGISYIMFVLFLYFLGDENYQLSLALSWFCSSFISFTMQKTIVFQTKGSWIAEYIRCLLSWSIAYVINALLLELCVTYFNLLPLVAQIIAVCFTTISTYFLFKYFAFRRG